MFPSIIAQMRQSLMGVFGIPITYTPAKGFGAPVSASALRRRQTQDQALDRAYFEDIEVDPAEIAAPKRGDLVTYPDGNTYIVNHVSQPTYGGFLLSLHRQ